MHAHVSKTHIQHNESFITLQSIGGIHAPFIVDFKERVEDFEGCHIFRPGIKDGAAYFTQSYKGVW